MDFSRWVTQGWGHGRDGLGQRFARIWVGDYRANILILFFSTVLKWVKFVGLCWKNHLNKTNNMSITGSPFHTKQTWSIRSWIYVEKKQPTISHQPSCLWNPSRKNKGNQQSFTCVAKVWVGWNSSSSTWSATNWGMRKWRDRLWAGGSPGWDCFIYHLYDKIDLD